MRVHQGWPIVRYTKLRVRDSGIRGRSTFGGAIERKLDYSMRVYPLGTLSRVRPPPWCGPAMVLQAVTAVDRRRGMFTFESETPAG